MLTEQVTPGTSFPPVSEASLTTHRKSPTAISGAPLQLANVTVKIRPGLMPGETFTTPSRSP